MDKKQLQKHVLTTVLIGLASFIIVDFVSKIEYFKPEHKQLN
jgi:hypothetical protein